MQETTLPFFIPTVCRFFVKTNKELLPISEKVFSFIVDKYVSNKIPEPYSQKELEKTYSIIKETLDRLNEIKK